MDYQAISDALNKPLSGDAYSPLTPYLLAISFGAALAIYIWDEAKKARKKREEEVDSK
jgi:hypothetical protein